MTPLLFIDFEFNQAVEENVNLVCVAYHNTLEKETKTLWLLDGKYKSWLREYLSSISRTHLIVGYAIAAEARCFYALGLNPRNFNWIDLYSEFRCVTNENIDLIYGDSLNSKGAVYGIRRNIRELKHVVLPSYSLAAAAFKLCGKHIDTDKKTEIRQLIINNDAIILEQNKDLILEYCRSDIQYLDEILSRIILAYKKGYHLGNISDQILRSDMLTRGKAACNTATIEQYGQPCNIEWLNNFMGNIPLFLYNLHRSINEKCREEFNGPLFKLEIRTGRFTMQQKQLREHFKNKFADKVSRWKKTPSGEISLELDELISIFGDRRHEYNDSVIDQVIRYRKTLQSLAGFRPVAKGKETIKDYIGSDQRIRPYLGVYGGKTGRFQPKTTGFIFLKAAWLRCLIQPPKGKVIIGLDYASQEFLIAALLSGDSNMIKAYHSGDPYMYFGIQDGTINPDASKKDPLVKKQRDKYKTTVLGMQYGMTKVGLSTNLTHNLGVDYSEEQAQELINKFWELFPELYAWQNKYYSNYVIEQFARISDGWSMFANMIQQPRTVKNFPVQGTAAAILRKAIDFCLDKNLKVIQTLHDAIYIETDMDSLISDGLKLKEAMQGAFRVFFPEYYDDNQNRIRLDGVVWGHTLEEKTIFLNSETPLKAMPLYLDDRSREEFELFQKYLVKAPEAFDVQASTLL